MSTMNTTTVHEPGVTVLVAYYSRFGVVRALAEQIAEGVRTVGGAAAALLAIADRPVEMPMPDESTEDAALRRAVVLNQLTAADAMVVGAPAYFGGMASPVKRLFEDCATASDPASGDRSRPWHGHLFRDKVGAAFVASGTPHGGNEAAIHSILTMMMHLGMIIVTPGQHLPLLDQDTAPYGATAIAGADGQRLPNPVELDDARELGRRVTEIALWLKRGKDAERRRRGGALRQTADALRAARDPGVRR
jgi:NAD(P)H dehydrogenase (quinone)